MSSEQRQLSENDQQLELEHQYKLQKAMEDLQAETSVDVDWLYRNKKKKRVTSTANNNITSSSNTNSNNNTSAATNALTASQSNDKAKTTSTTTTSNGLTPSTSKESTSSSKSAVTTQQAPTTPITPVTPTTPASTQLPKLHATPTTSTAPKAPTLSGTVPQTDSSLQPSPEFSALPPAQQTQQLPGAKPSLLSKALRPRSTSDPKRAAPASEQIVSPSQSNTNLTRSTSLNDQQKQTIAKQSSLTRSSSLNEQKPQKPIKSLFSAFSKFKKNSAPTTPSSSTATSPKSPKPPKSPSIQIPHNPSAQHSLQNHQMHSHSLASSIESISPKFHSTQPLLPVSETAPSRVILNKNPNRSLLPIKELSDLKLRRVTFALDKLADDPPQQIPSRRPKKGNVVVVEDLLSTEPLKLSVGITNEAKIETKVYDEREIKLIKDTQRKAIDESEKHAQEAHRAAQRIAHEVLNFKNKKGLTPIGTKDSDPEEREVEQDVGVINANLSNLEIDTKIHLHEHHFGDEIVNNEDHHIEVSLEAIYTRCCHLREILPIPATLKQLKGKSSPLNILKLLNPKPTLIDVYSFSDFIAIVPIKTLVFDNVTMTTEMFKIILSSLLNSNTIEKLSLRNVPIDIVGWKYLCKFISRKTTLHKLDISQQKIKADLPLSLYRSEMEWNLFIDTLIHRGGIEELLVNGCKLPIPIFQRLISEGVSIKTVRLGACQMDLTVEHIKILMDWATAPSSRCEGLDIGFNDLNNDKLKPLIKRISNAVNLQSISINSTHLVNVEDVALFVRSLSKLPNLRFLDLSNLPQIYPGILPYLNKYLPRFPKLTRIHLDFNELSTKSISIISEILPKCSNLVHVSIIGLSQISLPAAAALYSTAKQSKSLLNLDLDYELIDESISSRIALCLMRNMETSLNQPTSVSTDSHDDILFDGSLIAETAGKLIDKINKLKETEENDEFGQKFLQTQFLEKISRNRKLINKTIDELLEKRSQNGQLKLQEKEDLLRFYFLDTSLAHIVELFQNLDQLPSTSQSQQSNGNNISGAGVKATQNILTETPHQMASEVNGTAIDVSTGKPILLRSISQTSVQAKKQEEEEGEFHRWGFFVQQQRQILPPTNEDKPKPDSIVIPKLPSGSEIREAVIKAKGIDSINSLIDNVNHDRFNLNTIYPIVDKDTKQLPTYSDVETDDDIQEVDEAYDKILNDLSRVRSNK